MNRVMIIGQPGSGKSTLARLLGARTGLPVVHIDQVHWMSGWQERPRDQKISLIRAEEEKDRWIIEGGLKATWPTRLDRSDMLIWLDVGLTLRFWRVVMRLVRYRAKTRPDLPDGCPEQFGAVTLEFWLYIFRTHRAARRTMAETYAAYSGQKQRLTSVRETEAWLSQLTTD